MDRCCTGHHLHWPAAHNLWSFRSPVLWCFMQFSSATLWSQKTNSSSQQPVHPRPELQGTCRWVEVALSEEPRRRWVFQVASGSVEKVFAIYPTWEIVEKSKIQVAWMILFAKKLVVVPMVAAQHTWKASMEEKGATLDSTKVWWSFSPWH